MAIGNSPDIFQQKMNDLFHEFEIICAYIDELLTVKNVDCIDHVHKLELKLNKQKKKGFKCNIENSFSG